MVKVLVVLHRIVESLSGKEVLRSWEVEAVYLVEVEGSRRV